MFDDALNFLEWLKFWLVEVVEMVKHVLHWKDKTFTTTEAVSE